jgi:outer membrane lipoprotein-sorting protein
LRFLRSGHTTPYIAEQTTRTFDGGLAESTQVLKHAGPRRQRIEYLAPPRLAGEVILIAGPRLLHYRPRPRPRILEGDTDIADLAERAKELLASLAAGRVRVALVGGQIVAGRNTDILEIRSGPAAPFKRLWIDRETGVRLKHETVDQAGAVIVSSYFTKITYGPQLDPDDFRPDRLPPAPVEAQIPSSPPLESVAEAQRLVGFLVRVPALPPRFRLKGLWATGGPAAKGVLLQYTDGVNTVVLGQRRLPRTGAAPRVADGAVRSRRGVAFWVSGDKVYTLFANVRPEVLRRIVESLR